MALLIQSPHLRKGDLSFLLFIFTLCLILSPGLVSGATGFQLNFQPLVPSPTPGNPTPVCAVGVDCVIPGGNLAGGGLTTGNDGSKFVQEQLSINNQLYFHVVVGAPADGFAIESYTRASMNTTGSNLPDPLNPINGQNTVVNPPRAQRLINPFSPDSGGNEVNMTQKSTDRRGLPSVNTLFGNGKDPFGVGTYNGTSNPISTADRPRLTGNGTGDPTRVILRMKVSDANLQQEVLKPVMDRKPLISQVTTDNASMTSEFVADMRSLNYNQQNRVLPIVNRLVINDPGLPSPGLADFNMANAQRSHVTAGQYIYQQGTGWADKLLGWSVQGASFGTGTYSGPGNGFDPLVVDWARFFDPAQNPGCSIGIRGAHGICPP